MSFWNKDNVTRLKYFIENEWKVEHFTTREVMQSYYHQDSTENREYVPDTLIDEIVSK